VVLVVQDKAQATKLSETPFYYPWLPTDDLQFIGEASSIDAGDIVNWSELAWITANPLMGLVRSSNEPINIFVDVNASDWYTFTALPVDLSALPPGRYLEWRIFSSAPPAPDQVTVSHTPFAYTPASGMISEDTTWTAANSPYLVSSSMSVAEGSVLTIEPGVTVWFDDKHILLVQGAMVALGTAEKPITFTSWHGGKRPGDWGYIVFDDMAENTRFDANGNYQRGSALRHVIVEYAGGKIATSPGQARYDYPSLNYAIDAQNTVLYVDHTTIRHNSAGGIRVAGGALTHNTIISNSLTALSQNHGVGIVNLGSGLVAHNTVSGNQANGSTSFTLQGGGIHNQGGVVQENVVTDNRITGYQQVQGGGIFSQGGTVSHNRVEGNQVNSNGTIYGAGLYVVDLIGVQQNQVRQNLGQSSNNVTYGGGIYSQRTSLDQNLIEANTAQGRTQSYGGGVYSTGPYTLTSNLILSNTVTTIDTGSTGLRAHGGGIYTDRSVVENNEIRGNLADGSGGLGGGLYISDGQVRYNTLADNQAGQNSGAIHWLSGSGDLTYNTIADNRATGSGQTDGVYVVAGFPVIHHNNLRGERIALYNSNPAGSPRLDARYNWWGSAEANLLAATVYDFFDAPSLGFVNYVPYLAEEPSRNPTGGTVNGRNTGVVGSTYQFEVNVYPIAAIKPISYTWQIADHAPIVRMGDTLQDQVNLSWDNPGIKLIQITAANAQGSATLSYTIDIAGINSSDAYEPDNSCQQAGQILTDGTPQYRTIHSVNDEDWVTFQAVAGTTYVVEAATPDDSDADMDLEIYGACSGETQEGQDNSFGPDVSVAFIAPSSGPIYLRLRDEAGAVAAGRSASYYLTVRALSHTPDPGVVILVAGKLKENDPVQPNIYKVIEDAYRLFLTQAHPSDRIYYLAPDLNRDVTGDGQSNVDRLATRGNLRTAISQWARDRLQPGQSITLYLMDHGDTDVLYLNRLQNGTPETVPPRELSQWLSELESAVPDLKVNIVIEACRSGSFISASNSASTLVQTVSAPGRVVIASTGAVPLAYASPTGGAIFSDAFIAALGRGMSVNSSFAEARWTVQQSHPFQTPWLDDNGNGIPNEVHVDEERSDYHLFLPAVGQ
jgi:hypothetical protein